LGLKGIVFTLDSIIAFGIMVFIISFLIFFRTETVSPYLAAQQLHSMSEDILTVFSESKLREVVSQSVLQIYLTDGTLNQSDLDEKTIDVLGALWSGGKDEEAAAITKDILNTFIPSNLGYGLLINNINVYNSSDTSRLSYGDSSIEISSARIASGYEKYKATEGYVARVLAKRISKNNTLIVMGDVIYSSISKKEAGNKCEGSSGNTVNISYIIDIPLDANITDAYWFIESSWVDDKFKVFLNGNFLYESTGDPKDGGSALLTYEDLRNDLYVGRNIGHVEYRWGNPDVNAGGGCEGGDDGATHFVVSYNTSQISTLEEFGKQYFQTVIAEASIRYKKPIFVLGDIYNMSVHLNLTNTTEVKNVTLKFIWEGRTYSISTKSPINGVVEWDDIEIKNNLSSQGISYSILDGRFFWFMVDVDEYHRAELIDYERRIVGEDSYVSLNYSQSSEIYNFIDLTRTLSNYSYSDPDQYGFHRYVRWDYNLTNKIPLMSKWQFAWLYQSGSNPAQLARANDVILYDHDPSDPSSDPLVIEFVRFGYDTNPDEILIAGDNKFELNFSNGYAINANNSLGHTTFLAPASVSYGDIFDNETDAIDDAIQRLDNILGADISAMDITVESVSVAGVPYMWGPVEVRLRMWV
jgi:hypothetical protein